MPLTGVSGGRTWWAHFEFTRINIEPIILKNKIEDLREASAICVDSGLSVYRRATLNAKRRELLLRP